MGKSLARVYRRLVHESQREFMDLDDVVRRIERHEHEMLLAFELEVGQALGKVFGALDRVHLAAQNVARRELQAGEHLRRLHHPEAANLDEGLERRQFACPGKVIRQVVRQLENAAVLRAAPEDEREEFLVAGGLRAVFLDFFAWKYRFVFRVVGFVVHKAPF